MNRIGWGTILLLACKAPTPGAEKDVDAPADADADTDADSDADTDTGDGPVDGDSDGSPVGEDCDDDDPTVFPGAPDVCGDDRVTDCDRSSDDGLITVDGAATFTDLGAALAAASEGSTVLVCPGRYAGASSLVSVDLVAHGAVDATLIDGGEAGTALSLPGGSVTGVTVTRGASSGYGGGVAHTSTAPLLLSGCVVSGNRAVFGGGVSAFAGATVTISDTEISGNEASDGGGGVWVSAGATIDLTGSTVSGNTADYGGGIHVDNGSIVGGLVTGNTSSQGDAATGDPGGGGGISTFGAVSLAEVEIAENQAWLGGGIGAAVGPLTLDGVSVHDNSADGVGGGLFANGCDVTLDETSELRANAAAALGGGAYVVLGSLTGGVVTANDADAGGGIYLFDSELYDVVVEGNTAIDGGGVRLDRATAVSGGRISGNTASDSGGGLYVAGSTTAAALDGVEVADNRAVQGGGVHVRSGSVALTACSVLRNDDAGAAVDGGTLSSVASDWGVGVDDNVPGDVVAGSVLSGWGADASFDCTVDGCSPDPL